MTKTKWVVQTNLGDPRDPERIKKACEDHNFLFEGIKVIPFSEDLPEVSRKGRTLFYGSSGFTTLIQNSGEWSPGVYSNDENFCYESYQKHYGDLLLNSEADIITLEEFCKQTHDPLEEFFLRPNKDNKSFAGGVFTFKWIVDWFQRLASYDNEFIPVTTKVVIASPVNIKREWRLFIVDGKVSTGSQYRVGNKVVTSSFLPQEVLDFSEEVAERWPPARVFVLDIAETDSGSLRVLEANGMNSSGFYKSNVTKLLKDIG